MRLPVILILLFCLGAFVSFPVRADEIDESDGTTNTTNIMTPDKLVNAYYNRCLTTAFEDLAPATQQEFCACTSAHVKEAAQQDTLRESDLETLATGKGKPVDKGVLAQKIMAPCMAAPMKEMEFGVCMGDHSYAHYFKTDDAYNATCVCVANGIGQFIGDYGGDLMALLLKIDAGYADDPTNSLRQSGQYVQERGKLHNDCLNKYQGQ